MILYREVFLKLVVHQNLIGLVSFIQNAWGKKCFRVWSFIDFGIFVWTLLVEHPSPEKPVSEVPSNQELFEYQRDTPQISDFVYLK